MSLAPYFARASVAASQVLSGYDADAFAELLEATSVGIAFSTEDTQRSQGSALVDLTVRLLARLYPQLTLIATGPGAEEQLDAAQSLARAINPNIEFADQAPVGITIGAAHNVPTWPSTVYAGSGAWAGTTSASAPVEVGDDDIPFGAGIAACLAAAAIFRVVCLGELVPAEGHLSAFAPGSEPDLSERPRLEGAAALVGNGAIGHGALWALGRSSLAGELHCVDGELIDEGNLQRYVLATTGDVGKSKAQFAAEHLDGASAPLSGNSVSHHWPEAVARVGELWSSVAVAVDTAAGRRQVQATLPQWVANSWTQQGDLGVSEHNFEHGACVCCLYLPQGRSKNEDEVVASALGIPDRLLEVRELLYSGAPIPPWLLPLVGERLGVEPAVLAQFDALPIRQLYTAGICGSALLSVQEAVDLHVPLAHQSALAGVLLAARLVRRGTGYTASSTEICRIDVLRGPPAEPHQNASKDPRGICLCQDTDYVDAYRLIWA